MRRAIVVVAALVIALALGAWLYNRRAEQSIAGQYYIPKATRMTPDVQLLQQYVRIDTSNPPGRELAGARFLADLLSRSGVHAEIIESSPGRASVYARLKGSTPGEGLLLLNHIDVVPADAKAWQHPPFAGAIALNQLWGRGALDMKGIAICQLEAFIAVARRGTPQRDIVFLAVADEEAGGKLGTRWLLEHRPDVFEGIRYALNEGGITETQRDAITYFGIEVGTKMEVRAELRAPSRAQLQAARIALEPYFSPRDPDRVVPEVRDFLKDLAPQRLQYRPLLENIDRTIAAGKLWLLPQGYRELTQNIVWVQGVSSDGAGPRADATLSNLPDEEPAQRIAWLRRAVKPYGVSVAVQETMGPSPISRRDTPLFALIEREAHAIYGNVPVGTEILVAFANDSRYLRSRGVTCYGVWPFAVDYFQSQGIHATDERVRLDWFDRGVAFMRRVVDAYAFPSEQR